MLKSIDILISLTVVLLALSMAVTVITQSITTIVNSRGSHLKRGLIDMLRQLDPALTTEVSAKVADALLRHPLVSASSVPFLNKARLGNVVHREEFTKLLMGLATGGTGGADPAAILEKSAKDALVTALKNNGVPDPEGALKNIRTAAMQLERSSPALSHAARQTAALLQAAESDLVAKVNGWFDQTMDRVSQRFTASTRVITFAGAFIVAFGLQVDTPMLFNRLSADDVLREKLVKEAQTLPSAPASGASEQVTAEFDSRYRGFLDEAGIISLPNAGDWLNGYKIRSKLAGMLVTALLLSLGAPFWYGVLSNLLQLRSVLARKDDAQRDDRQLEQPPAATAKNASSAPAIGGAAAAAAAG
jgi:hypothetical protein